MALNPQHISNRRRRYVPQGDQAVNGRFLTVFPNGP